MLVSVGIFPAHAAQVANHNMTLLLELHFLMMVTRPAISFTCKGAPSSQTY